MLCTLLCKYFSNHKEYFILISWYVKPFSTKKICMNLAAGGNSKKD